MLVTVHLHNISKNMRRMNNMTFDKWGYQKLQQEVKLKASGKTESQETARN